MASKSVSHPYQIFASTAVSGTQAVTSSVTNVLYRDSVAFQFSWTGNPQGTFDIQASIDYGQGTPQSKGLNESVNVGTWTSLTLSPSATIGSGTLSIMVNANQLSFAAVRTVYTNSTGSGVLTGWTCAKSLGV